MDGCTIDGGLRSDGGRSSGAAELRENGGLRLRRVIRWGWGWGWGWVWVGMGFGRLEAALLACLLAYLLTCLLAC
jgi:hypothetical protein